MNYHHLTIEERCCIREFYKNGKTFREIAVLVGRNVSTISREINRNKSIMNCKPAYYPHTAQKKYLLRRSFCHRGMFWNEQVIYYINDKLKKNLVSRADSKYVLRIETTVFQNHIPMDIRKISGQWRC